MNHLTYVWGIPTPKDFYYELGTRLELTLEDFFLPFLGISIWYESCFLGKTCWILWTVISVKPLVQLVPILITMWFLPAQHFFHIDSPKCLIKHKVWESVFPKGGYSHISTPHVLLIKRYWYSSIWRQDLHSPLLEPGQKFVKPINRRIWWGWHYMTSETGYSTKLSFSWDPDPWNSATTLWGTGSHVERPEADVPATVLDEISAERQQQPSELGSVPADDCSPKSRSCPTNAKGSREKPTRQTLPKWQMQGQIHGVMVPTTKFWDVFCARILRTHIFLFSHVHFYCSVRSLQPAY